MIQNLNRKPLDISIAIAETVTDYPENVCPECINKILEIVIKKIENNDGSSVKISRSKLQTATKSKDVTHLATTNGNTTTENQLIHCVGVDGTNV